MTKDASVLRCTIHVVHIIRARNALKSAETSRFRGTLGRELLHAPLHLTCTWAASTDIWLPNAGTKLIHAIHVLYLWRNPGNGVVCECQWASREACLRTRMARHKKSPSIFLREDRRAGFGQCRDTPTKHALRRRSGRIIRPITCSTAHNGRSARPQSSTLANLED